MANQESNAGLISEELFDRFRSSHWPNSFSSMVHHAREQSKPLEDTLRVHEIGLIIAPKEEVEILNELGVTENTKDKYLPTVDKPLFTEFGKQVIAVCEGLLTPEEYVARNEAAKPRVEQKLTEIQAFLDSLG